MSISSCEDPNDHKYALIVGKEQQYAHIYTHIYAHTHTIHIHICTYGNTDCTNNWTAFFWEYNQRIQSLTDPLGKKIGNTLDTCICNDGIIFIILRFARQ